jgi:hypothetical protein
MGEFNKEGKTAFSCVEVALLNNVEWKVCGMIVRDTVSGWRSVNFRIYVVHQHVKQTPKKGKGLYCT